MCLMLVSWPSPQLQEQNHVNWMQLKKEIMTQCYEIFEEFTGTYSGILMSWLLMEKDVILQTGLSMLHRWWGRD